MSIRKRIFIKKLKIFGMSSQGRLIPPARESVSTIPSLVRASRGHHARSVIDALLGTFQTSLILFLTITLFAVIGCAPVDAGPKEGEYVVRNVVDGDTIELANGKKVRYTGIDTPETMRRTGGEWVFAPEAFGVQAKKYNKELMAGKKVTLEFDVVKEDKYGRWLAYVYLDGVMVNEEMIRQGYATLYTFPPNMKYVDRFLRAQEEARDNKRGFWGALKEISPGEAFENVGQFRVVTGRVENIFVSPNRIFLNLGPDRSKDLTAVIFTRNIPVFEKMGVNPFMYEGSTVEVVGKIENERNPQMIIDNPSQIRLVNIKG